MSAHVDLITGKIYGCKKYSREWWHEKGHIEYNKLEISGTLRVWQGIFLWVWMVFITLTFIERSLLGIAIPFVIGYIIIEFFEEAWCNDYAKKHFKKRR